MNVEQARLDTFQIWRSNNLAASPLARNGFFATGNDLEIQCHWCAIRINDWTDADQVIERHWRLSPTCPLLQNSNNVENATTQQPQTTQSESTESTGLFNEQNRLATFRNWPVSFITSQSLAKAGFYYFNQSDRVRCAWCKGVIAKWEVGDNPFTEHLRFFPNCPWAQLGPNVEISSGEPFRHLGIQPIRPPKRERYSTLDARLRSFTNWPTSAPQTPEALATAGFYYQDQNDQVRCFHCNGGLRSWEHDDDAWFEHARWFPKCEFLQLVKGKQYIEQVKRQTNPTLEEVMSSELVKAALEMGLNVERIRSVVKTHLDRFHSFKNADELIDAVLERGERVQEGPHDDDDDDDIEASTSVIVRELGSILDTILKSRRSITSATTTAPTTTAPTTTITPTTTFASTSWNDDIHRRRSENEPTIQVSDDIVVVEIPRGLSGHVISPDIQERILRFDLNSNSINQSNQTQNQCSNELPPNIVSTERIGATSPHQELSDELIPTFGVRTVPEKSENENAEVPTTCGSSVIQESSSHSAKPSSQSDSDKNLSLEEENRKLKDARLCKVCMDDDVAVVFLPCGHLVTCVQCAPSVTACPLCRTAIKAFVRTFLS